MLMRCARPTVTAKFEAFEMWGFYVLLGNTSMDRIPGTDGFRKIRWEDARRGKGERGGLRIIYYCFTSAHQIWFFTIYGKNEVTDLTTDEKRALRMAIHAELDARRQQS